MEWIDNEVVGCHFEDVRHRKRLRHLLEQFSDRAGSTTPWASQDRANTKAAYRFFDNERISEISGSFQVIEIVTDLLGCKQTPDFTDEGRHLSGEQGIALGGVQEGEEFLADQIVSARFPGRTSRGYLRLPCIGPSRFCGTLLGRCSCSGSHVQDTAHRSAADLETACDFGFALDRRGAVCGPDRYAVRP